MSLSLEDEVLLLRAQVDYLLERTADASVVSEGPVNWVALDREQAEQQWQHLIDWTRWLRHRYQLHETVPACWFAHGALVEELSALRCAWTGAFLSPHADLGDAASWHDLLDRTRYRLREWDRNGCASGTHRPDIDLPDDTDPALLDRAIHHDVEFRHTEGPTA